MNLRKLSHHGLVLLLALATLIPLPRAVAQQPDSTDSSPHSSISIGAERQGIAAGETVTIALRVDLDPGWHTYWLNGGDAGLPLVANWVLPPGVKVTDFSWPPPELVPTPPLMSYAYHDQLILLAEVSAERGITGPVTIAATVDWLVCADICLPATDSIALTLPLTSAGAPANGAWASVIAEARGKLPSPSTDWSLTAWKRDSSYILRVVGAPVERIALPYLFVDSVETIEPAVPQLVGRTSDALFLELPRSIFALSDAPRLRGILVADASRASLESWWINTPVLAAPPDSADAWMIQASNDVVVSGGALLAAEEAGSLPGAGNVTFLLALVLAFVGGLILNLMPCVFPVLSLKVLGIVKHGAHNPVRARQHGLVFGIGVVLSFWILAGLLYALRAGGESLGWGFQLQSPLVVALLALLLLALGLNLSGLFEIGLSLTRLGATDSGDKLSSSLLTGGLAVLVATPCTAPFMGAALGFAIVQPPVVGLAVFTALAIGLAAPYVVLASVPAFLAKLPRPGAWMERVKHLLAYPLYATVVWLVWVFGQQVGTNATALLLVGLGTLGVAGWLYGKSQHSGRLATRLAAAFVLLLAIASPVAGTQLTESEKALSVSAAAWVDYSAEQLASLRSSGTPVLLDFTAAWCLSCQVNERIALERPETLRAIRNNGVVLMRADWTSRDAEIAKAIQSFGRTGIPLYVLFPAHPNGAPEVLPTILTPSIVIRAIERAVAGSESTQLSGG